MNSRNLYDERSGILSLVYLIIVQQEPSHEVEAEVTLRYNCRFPRVIALMVMYSSIP